MNKIPAPGITKRITNALLTISAVLLVTQDVSAQNRITAPPILVTASRLDSGLTGAASGTSTTIVTSEQINQSPGRTLPEILSFEAGVQLQELYGSTNGAGQTIDIRGFGEPATANTLILINGRRLTDLDLAAVDFSSIPRDSINRIEITRGNLGGVLYGGGAQGGVINIITKSHFKDGIHGEIKSGYGSDRLREINFTASQATDSYFLSVYGNKVLGDGYRENSSLRQSTLAFKLSKRLTSGDVFLHVDFDDQTLGLPGWQNRRPEYWTKRPC